MSTDSVTIYSEVDRHDGAGKMSRLVNLTKVSEERGARSNVKVNLDHVLWMESEEDGTRLFLNDVLAPGVGASIINTSILVKESTLDILDLADEWATALSSGPLQTS